MAEKDNEYQKFFKSAMKKFGIESPEDFKSESEKKKFFDYVDKNWKAKKESVTKTNSLILRNSDKLNSKWDKKMNKLTENRLRKIVNRLVEEQLNEYFELDKLEDAIKLFQDKIKKQGRITNARDEEHLEKLIKIYKEMGGKNIKSLDEVHMKKLTENRLRKIVNRLVEEQLNENVGFEIGDFVHFKSANKTGMVKKISGKKVTIMTMDGDFTGDINDIEILYQD